MADLTGQVARAAVDAAELKELLSAAEAGAAKAAARERDCKRAQAEAQALQRKVGALEEEVRAAKVRPSPLINHPYTLYTPLPPYTITPPQVRPSPA